MKVKPKEIMVNLPVALMFDSEDKIAEFASSINTIIHGKVKVKCESIGKLQDQYIGLFYLQRNNESQELRDRFTQMIDDEWMKVTSSKEEEKVIENIDSEHGICWDCDSLIIPHQKGINHCFCGEELVNNKCPNNGN